MNIKITAQEIRKGDKIRLTREFVAEGPVDGDGEVETVHGHYVYVTDDTMGIELLAREPEPLPTEKGSVIRVFSSFGEGRWMLTETANGDYPLWVSAIGARKNPSQMAALIAQRPDRAFEVIA